MRPGVANRGARRVGVQKRALPLPPRPPFNTVLRTPPRISATIRPVSPSMITVPAGTSMMRSAPSLPVMLFFRPCSPFCAENFVLKRKSIRVRFSSEATNITSPPSGPPAATYFSRWKETAPFPPFPAFIVILTLSTIIIPNISAFPACQCIISYPVRI